MTLELHDPRLSYVHGASDVPLIGATIGDLFDRVAAQVPDNEALVSVHQGLRYTYREFRSACDAFARGLLALGIQKGDRIGVWSPNHAEWVIVQFATPKIGAILVNINPAYRAYELEYALKQSGCAALIIAPPFKTSDYAALLNEVCPELAASAPGKLCSAKLPELRTVIAFVALGVVVALVGTRRWWKRVLLVGLAPVVAVVLNAARIATLGLLSQYNPRFSEGEAHMLIGTLLLVPGFVFYLGVLWSLNKAAPEQVEREDTKPSKPANPTGGRVVMVKPA